MCLMRLGQRFFLYSHKIDHCMLVVFAVQEQKKCFIWLDYDIIWKKRLDLTISGPNKVITLSLDHAEKSSLLVTGHIWTVEVIRLVKKLMGRIQKHRLLNSRHSLPFSVLHFFLYPQLLPFFTPATQTTCRPQVYKRVGISQVEVYR